MLNCKITFCLLLSLISIFQSRNGYCQKLENPYNFSVKPQYGFIISHSNKIKNVSDTNPFGIELEYSKLLIKENNFQQCNCYSKAGLAFLFIDFANPDILGNSYNFIGYIEPLLIRKEKVILSTRMGVGLSFLDHIYNDTNNFENQFFSSHISFIVHLDLNIYFKLSKKIYLTSYAKYNHISNGGLKQPNYGMNFPTFGIGLNYFPKSELEFPVRAKKRFSSEYFKKAFIFGTMKSILEDEYNREESVLILGIYGLIGKTVSNVNGFSIGVEYLNDGANKERIIREELSLDHQQVSGLIGHHFLFGKFDFSQSWGIYVYAPYKYKNFFQRYSLSYQFLEYFNAGVTLKAHAHIADNFNILLGMSF